jgi:hypothetical protein
MKVSDKVNEEYNEDAASDSNSYKKELNRRTEVNSPFLTKFHCLELLRSEILNHLMHNNYIFANYSLTNSD